MPNKLKEELEKTLTQNPELSLKLIDTLAGKKIPQIVKSVSGSKDLGEAQRRARINVLRLITGPQAVRRSVAGKPAVKKQLSLGQLYDRALDFGAGMGPRNIALYGAGIPAGLAGLLFARKLLRGRARTVAPSILQRIIKSRIVLPLTAGAAGYHILDRILGSARST